MGLFDGLKKNKQDFEKTTKYGALKLDEPRKLFKAAGRIISWDDLISFELIENGNSITEGGISLGRAVLGGSVLGSSGAALGGLTKVKKENKEYCTNLSILVTIKNNKNSTFSIPFIGIKTDKSKIIYNQALSTAKSTIAGFNFIIDSRTDATVKEFDNLKKLKELLDLGILTNDEFDKKKNEILNK